MDIKLLIAELVMIVIAVVLIAYPLFKSQIPLELIQEDLSPHEIRQTGESVFAVLGEIEFDYRMKKLSKDDYQKLQEQYKRQAVDVLKTEENDEAMVSLAEDRDTLAALEREIDEEIEAEIWRMKAQTALRDS